MKTVGFSLFLLGLLFQNVFASEVETQEVKSEAHYVGIQIYEFNEKYGNSFFLRELVNVDETEERVVLNHFTTFEDLLHDLSEYDDDHEYRFFKKPTRQPKESLEGFELFVELARVNWPRIARVALANYRDGAEEIIPLLPKEEFKELWGNQVSSTWFTSFIYKGIDENGRFLVQPVKLAHRQEVGIWNASRDIENLPNKPAGYKKLNSSRDLGGLLEINYSYVLERPEEGDRFERD